MNENISEPCEFVGKTILIVDDNATNREVATELLRDMGVGIHSACDGWEALEKVQKRSYDLVFMDVQMPLKDGWTTAQEIRALGSRYKDLPIIAMTAYALEEDRKKSFSAGMNGHITKPLDYDVIKTLLIEIFTEQSIKTTTPKEKSPSKIPEIHGFDFDSALNRLRGNKDLLIRLLVSFSKNNMDTEKTILNKIEEGNLVTVKRIAHQLKGSGANLGAIALSESAAKIEQAIKDGVTTLPAGLVSDLSEALKDLVNISFNLESEGKINSLVSIRVEVNKEIFFEKLRILKYLLKNDVSQALTEIEKISNTFGNSVYSGLVTEIEHEIMEFNIDEASALIDKALAY